VKSEKERKPPHLTFASTGLGRAARREGSPKKTSEARTFCAKAQPLSSDRGFLPRPTQTRAQPRRRLFSSLFSLGDSSSFPPSQVPGILPHFRRFLFLRADPPRYPTGGAKRNLLLERRAPPSLLSRRAKQEGQESFFIQREKRLFPCEMRKCRHSKRERTAFLFPPPPPATHTRAARIRRRHPYPLPLALFGRADTENGGRDKGVLFFFFSQLGENSPFPGASLSQRKREHARNSVLCKTPGQGQQETDHVFLGTHQSGNRVLSLPRQTATRERATEGKRGIPFFGSREAEFLLSLFFERFQQQLKPAQKRRSYFWGGSETT